MSQERLKMKKLREVLRLHYECQLSNRKIAKALSVSATTVGNYLKAAQAASLDWRSANKLNNSELTELLENDCAQLKAISTRIKKPNFVQVHNELKRKGVTRELLHQEYHQSCVDLRAMSYTEFCRQYRLFKKALKPSMRQTHVAGEKTFIDYAGPKVPIHNGSNGEIHEAVIFIAVLGASNYTFAEATLTRSLPDWVGSHIRMFEYFGGVTELLIPDNEKSGVHKACYYDPDVNSNYAALAAHYNTAVLPARPYHPKDKAKAEVGVQIVERWILARLRHKKFFSLRELNNAIATLLVDLNNKPFKKLPGTRRSQYEEIDRPQLSPLPDYRYEFVNIKKMQVRLDYHVELEAHFYSVPHQYITKQVECHLGENMVSIFYQGQRIAYHIRSEEKGGCTTIEEHMPAAHKQHAQWSPAKFLLWAALVGKHMKLITQHVITHKPHPEWCYRIHLGFMNLKKRYGDKRLEEACQFALEQRLMSLAQIKSILATQADKAPLIAANDSKHPKDSEPKDMQPCQHHNLRGADYYSKTQ